MCFVLPFMHLAHRFYAPSIFSALIYSPPHLTYITPTYIYTEWLECITPYMCKWWKQLWDPSMAAWRIHPLWPSKDQGFSKSSQTGVAMLSAYSFLFSASPNCTPRCIDSSILAEQLWSWKALLHLVKVLAYLVTSGPCKTSTNLLT